MSLRIEDFCLKPDETLPSKNKKLNNKNTVNNKHNIHKGMVIIQSFQ